MTVMSAALDASRQRRARAVEPFDLVVHAGMFTTVKPFRARDVREHNIKSSSSLKVQRVLFLDVDLAELAG